MRYSVSKSLRSGRPKAEENRNCSSFEQWRQALHLVALPAIQENLHTGSVLKAKSIGNRVDRELGSAADRTVLSEDLDACDG